MFLRFIIFFLEEEAQIFQDNIEWNWTINDFDDSNPDSYIDLGRTFADYNEI